MVEQLVKVSLLKRRGGDNILSKFYLRSVTYITNVVCFADFNLHNLGLFETEHSFLFLFILVNDIEKNVKSSKGRSCEWRSEVGRAEMGSITALHLLLLIAPLFSIM